MRTRDGDLTLLSIAQQPSRVKDMDFAPSPRAVDLAERVRAFIDTEIEPVEPAMLADVAARRARGEDAWPPPAALADLAAKARAQGLWNLFLPAGHGDAYAERFGTDGGAGLSNTDYASIAEQMGRSALAPLVFNCNAPDTGNMEVLLKYGTPEQQEQWLDPLLDGRIRSTFLMTEPGVASSDATNMQATATLDGDEVVLDGRKWWSTGAGHPDCRIGVFMGLTDPSAHRHRQHSMVLVPWTRPASRSSACSPRSGSTTSPSVTDRSTWMPSGCPPATSSSGPGRAFEIAQGRLGPGRVHHCMRLIGLAEKSLELACERSTQRVAFGKPIANLGGNRERLARARIAINQARLHVLHAAWKLDTVGIEGAQSEVSEIKAAVPQMACDVIDLAIQLHGGGGMSDDFPLAAAYAGARSLRLADGPDEVHLGVVARHLLRPYAERAATETASTATASGSTTGATPAAADEPARPRHRRGLGAGPGPHRAHARPGDTVLVVDLAEDRPDAVPEGAAYRRLDVRSQQDWDAAMAWVRDTWGGLDLLVNNAGVATGGRIDVESMSDWERVVDINLLGVARGCHTFTPMFKAQKSGHIVNVASLAGLVHGPGMSSYNATKAGVVALSETLSFELAPWSIDVSVVCPAFFRTNLHQSFSGKDAAMQEAGVRLITQASVDAAHIAAIVLKGVDARKRVILTDRLGRQAYYSKRFVRPLYDRMLTAQAKRLARRAGADPAELTRD
jgi:acyl-CoA dehydrogenase